MPKKHVAHWLTIVLVTAVIITEASVMYGENHIADCYESGIVGKTYAQRYSDGITRSALWTALVPYAPLTPDVQVTVTGTEHEMLHFYVIVPSPVGNTYALPEANVLKKWIIGQSSKVNFCSFGFKQIGFIAVSAHPPTAHYLWSLRITKRGDEDNTDNVRHGKSY